MERKTIPTPEELDAYLTVLRKHDVSRFETDAFTVLITKEPVVAQKMAFAEPPVPPKPAPGVVQPDELDTWSATQ